MKPLCLLSRRQLRTFLHTIHPRSIVFHCRCDPIGWVLWDLPSELPISFFLYVDPGASFLPRFLFVFLPVTSLYRRLDLIISTEDRNDEYTDQT